MKLPSYSILIALQLAVTWFATGQTDTDREAPIILANAYHATIPSNDPNRPAIAISPRVLDFGSVPVGNIKELSFTIRNMGAGILTGTANVPAPFNICEGGAYVLKDPQAQVITVQFAPKSIGMHMAVVHLTDGATVTVMGSAAPALRKAPARRHQSTDPPGLKLIAWN
jgi:hypothetical protein